MKVEAERLKEVEITLFTGNKKKVYRDPQSHTAFYNILANRSIIAQKIGTKIKIITTNPKSHFFRVSVSYEDVPNYVFYIFRIQNSEIPYHAFAWNSKVIREGSIKNVLKDILENLENNEFEEVYAELIKKYL
jgi:hypothetical protein